MIDRIRKSRLGLLVVAVIALLGGALFVAPSASAVTAVIYQAHCGLTGTTAVGGADDKTILPGQVGWVEFDFYTTINGTSRKPGAPTAGGTKEFRFYNHSDVYVTVQEMRYRYVPTGQSQMKDVVTAFVSNWNSGYFEMMEGQFSNQFDRAAADFTRYGNGDWKMNPNGYTHVQAVGYTQYWNRYFPVANDPNILVIFNYVDHSGVVRNWPCYATLNP